MTYAGQINDTGQTGKNLSNGAEEKIWSDKFTDPSTVGCELADELLETDEETLIDTFDFMTTSRDTFFTHLEGNECTDCSGRGSQKQHRAKCTGCIKDPINDAIK